MLNYQLRDNTVLVMFFQKDDAVFEKSKKTFESIADSLGLKVLGWREVPHDSSILVLPHYQENHTYCSQPLFIKKYGVKKFQMTNLIPNTEKILKKVVYFKKTSFSHYWITQLVLHLFTFQ